MAEGMSSEEFFSIYRKAVFGKTQQDTASATEGNLWERIQNRREKIKEKDPFAYENICKLLEDARLEKETKEQRQREAVNKMKKSFNAKKANQLKNKSSKKDVKKKSVNSSSMSCSSSNASTSSSTSSSSKPLVLYYKKVKTKSMESAL